MTGDAALLEQGEKIVDAVIDHLTDTNGVLTEVHCGNYVYRYMHPPHHSYIFVSADYRECM